MILIAGAGIGGLTLALLLHEAGLRFRLFEAATAPPDYDLGFLLRPDAVATLRRLGFGAALARIGVPVRAEVRYGVDGRLVGRRDWPPDAGGLLSVHRGALHRLLADAVKARAGPECLLYGLAVDDWTEGADGIALRLANRRDHSAAGDARGAVLVAADGIDSIARARIFPAEGAARWTGVAVWRGVAPGPRLDEVVILGDAACRMTLTPLPPDRQGMARINWIAERRMPPDSTWASLRRGGRGAMRSRRHSATCAGGGLIRRP